MDWNSDVHDKPPEYNALHDPHLHKLFESKRFKQHLLEKGFINEKGKVLCGLKQFNRYRLHLAKLYHQLEQSEVPYL